MYVLLESKQKYRTVSGHPEDCAGCLYFTLGQTCVPKHHISLPVNATLQLIRRDDSYTTHRSFPAIISNIRNIPKISHNIYFVGCSGDNHGEGTFSNSQRLGA